MISFIKKTIVGLSKTRNQINKLFAGLSGKSFLEEIDLEKLEEILLGADLGWEITEHLVESVKLPDKKEIKLPDRFSYIISKYLHGKAEQKKLNRIIIVVFNYQCDQIPFFF